MRKQMRNLGLAALLGFVTSPLMAQDVYLVAKAGTVTMPDGVNIPIWGFAEDPDGFGVGVVEGSATLPGPRITVPAGDTTLTIHLRNDLADEPVSIIIPGQVNTTPGMAPVEFTTGPYAGRVRSLAQEAAPGGGTQTYTWNNLKPGTYLYRSGTHQQVQVQMGLYGAMTHDVPKPVIPDPNPSIHLVYPDINYGQEVLLLYSEIDPALHQAVVTHAYGPGKPMTSTIHYHPEYFLINGQPYTTGDVPIPVGNDGGHVLLRFLNASLETHVPTLQGLYMEVVAEDGDVYNTRRPQYSLHLAAGQTRDALLLPDCDAGLTESVQTVFDSSLSLTNVDGSTGGMLFQLQLTDADGDGVVGICDNCIDVANADQLDTNSDGFGNICDTDLNGDGVTNLADVGILKTQFLTPGPDADFNGNGIVNLLDVGILKLHFLQPPGPSGLAP